MATPTYSVAKPIYSDIDIELTKQSDGDITRDDDVQAIFNSLRNIVMTIQGERRMRPDFAYGPYTYLFEHITESNAISFGSIIKSVIEQYENRITIVNIHVEYSISDNLYKPTVSFTINGMGPDVIETISFILKRL
jgi:phage baseplate assembly protein W